MAGNSSRDRAEEGEKLTIPRGGPIYVSNCVGPIISVPAFQSSILEELQDVYSLCSADSSSTSDFDISVDELKVLTDEELVDMAMKEAFKEEEVAQASSRPSHGDAVSGEEDQTVESSGDGKSTAALTKSDNGTMSKKSLKKKRRKAITNTMEDHYIEKVEQLAKIKQKQDEDKAVAAARLHSLMSGSSCNINEFPNSGSDGMERLKTLRSINSEIKVKSSRGLRHVPLQNPEVVLCIEIYHSRKTWTKTQEFLVLGRQTLTELRDNMYCITDLVMQKAGEHDPSGYFLIEDVFYNDMRNPSAINYSEPIIDWLRNCKEEALKKWKCITTGELSGKQKAIVGEAASPDLPQFKAVDMQRVRFCDLRFRLGAGYMYCHQGDCKHTIVIRDMRLAHPEDVQNRAAYPLVTYQLKLRAQKCNICKIYRAKMVTMDDKWAQQNPCYFCENCYYLLHHSSDGSLVYDDFLVYDYHPD